MNMNDVFYSLNDFFDIETNDYFDMISDIADHVTINDDDGSIYFRNGESYENGKGAYLLYKDGKMVFGGNDIKSDISFMYDLPEMTEAEYVDFVNDRVREWFVSGFY